MNTAIIPVLIEDDVNLDELCEFVGNGGTLDTFCQDRGLSFSEVNQWVKNHPARKRRYETALAIRQEKVAQTIGNMMVSLVRFDPKDVFHPDGTYRKIHTWPPEARAALESVDVDPVTGEIIKAKFVSRAKSLELLGKTAGVFREVKEAKDGQLSLSDVLRKLTGHDDTQ